LHNRLLFWKNISTGSSTELPVNVTLAIFGAPLPILWQSLRHRAAGALRLYQSCVMAKYQPAGRVIFADETRLFACFEPDVTAPA